MRLKLGVRENFLQVLNGHCQRLVLQMIGIFLTHMSVQYAAATWHEGGYTPSQSSDSRGSELRVARRSKCLPIGQQLSDWRVQILDLSQRSWKEAQHAEGFRS